MAVLKNTYIPAWKLFRSISQETQILTDVVRELVADIPKQEQNFTFIDVGCGDGDLTQKILSASIWRGHLPQLIYLVEPLDGFSNDLLSSRKAIEQNGLGKYNCSVHQLNFKDFELKKTLCIPGVILLTHASYYFNSQDIDKLKYFQEQGYTIIIVENHIDCWVSQVFKNFGNSYHPQLDHNRLVNILNTLGKNEKDIVKKQYSVELTMPSESEIEKMIDFFSCSWTDNLPDRKTLITSLIRAWETELKNCPKFVYSSVSIYPTNS